MGFFDLHCDTLRQCVVQGTALTENQLAVSVERGKQLSPWVQVFAATVYDEESTRTSYKRFLSQVKVLRDAMEASKDIVPFSEKDVQPGKCNAMLAVANGALIGSSLDKISELKELGVRIFAPVWNGENRLGGGVNSESGLTDFGRKVVKRLQREKIAVDVSHMNRYTFWDLCSAVDGPLIATHSNCFDLCPHQRNLDDLQIKEIISRGGLIGINFYPIFINGESDASFQEIRAHIHRVVDLGGENNIAVGSDFDGAAMPTRLNRIEKVADWFENLYKHFDSAFVEKITYQNALDFFQNRL